MATVLLVETENDGCRLAVLVVLSTLDGLQYDIGSRHAEWRTMVHEWGGSGAQTSCY